VLRRAFPTLRRLTWYHFQKWIQKYFLDDAKKRRTIRISIHLDKEYQKRILGHTRIHLAIIPIVGRHFSQKRKEQKFLSLLWMLKVRGKNEEKVSSERWCLPKMSLCKCSSSPPVFSCFLGWEKGKWRPTIEKIASSGQIFSSVQSFYMVFDNTCWYVSVFEIVPNVFFLSRAGFWKSPATNTKKH